jgi:hypothetical protein
MSFKLVLLLLLLLSTAFALTFLRLFYINQEHTVCIFMTNATNVSCAALTAYSTQKKRAFYLTDCIKQIQYT